MKYLRSRGRPSPALVVAIAALSVSLVGTAFAGPIAEISGLNKKDKQQIRKMARNIAGKVSNRQVTKRAPGLAVASANTAGSANTADTARAAGSAADAEKLGGVPLSGFLGSDVVVKRVDVPLPKESAAAAVAVCPAGWKATGGGVNPSGVVGNASLIKSYPSTGSVTQAADGATPTSWGGRAENPTIVDGTLYVFAICVSSP